MAAQCMDVAGGAAVAAAASARWSNGEALRANIVKKTRMRERLRVGFVSSDWHHSHPVSQCIRGIFHYLNGDMYAPMAYTTHRELGVGGDIADEASVPFYSIDGLSAQMGSARIVEDQVNVLLHINGYTKWERTDVFALQPAPIQMSAIGYSNSHLYFFSSRLTILPLQV